MLKSIALTVFSLLLVTPALAQNRDWSGSYVGIDAGYSSSKLIASTNPEFTQDLRGEIATLSFGHWTAVEEFLLGWDVALTAGGPFLQREDSFEEVVIVTGFDGPIRSYVRTTEYEVATGEIASLDARAKVGSPIGPVLTYLAGGPSVSLTTDYFQIENSVYSDVSVDLGLTAAIGLEAPVTANLSVRAELGYDFLNPTLSALGAGTELPYSLSGPYAKGGLSYHFN
jgi:opacity protein-like surface antigen